MHKYQSTNAKAARSSAGGCARCPGQCLPHVPDASVVAASGLPALACWPARVLSRAGRSWKVFVLGRRSAGQVHHMRIRFLVPAVNMAGSTLSPNPARDAGHPVVPGSLA